MARTAYISRTDEPGVFFLLTYRPKTQVHQFCAESDSPYRAVEELRDLYPSIDFRVADTDQDAWARCIVRGRQDGQAPAFEDYVSGGISVIVNASETARPEAA